MKVIRWGAHPVTTEEEADKAAWEHSGALSHAVHLLTLQYFSHVHALPSSRILYTIDNDRLLELDAVKQLQPTASTIPVVSAFVSLEVF